MVEFIKTFYSNMQVIKMRKMNVIFVIILFFLTIFLSSIPNYVGRYATTLNEYEVLYPSLDLVVETLSNDYGLKLEDSVMKFNNESKFNIEGYNIILSDTEDSNANSTILIKPSEFYIANSNGDFIRGNYETLSNLDFKDYSDLKTTSYLFLKNVDLGTFTITMITIFMANFIQTLMYALVVSILMMIIKKSHNLKENYSFKEVITMVVILLFSSSFLVAMLGMFRPSIASVSLSLFFLIRFMRFYYYQFRSYFYAT